MWSGNKEIVERMEQIKKKNKRHRKKLKKFRDVGERLFYLGAPMIVREHTYKGIMVCDYRTENGEIKSISFNYRDLPHLESFNEGGE